MSAHPEELRRIGCGTYETLDGRYQVTRADDSGRGLWNLLELDCEQQWVWCQQFATKRDAWAAIALCRQDAETI